MEPVSCRNSSRYRSELRPRRHEPPADEIDLEIETLQRTCAEQHKVVGFAENDLVDGVRSTCSDDREPDPSLEHCAVRLSKAEHFAARDAE